MLALLHLIGKYTISVFTARKTGWPIRILTVEQNNFAQSKYQLQAYTINNYLQLLRLQDYLAIQYRNIQRNQEILRSIQSLTKSGVQARRGYQYCRSRTIKGPVELY